MLVPQLVLNAEQAVRALIYNYIHDVCTASPNTFLLLLTLRQF